MPEFEPAFTEGADIRISKPFRTASRGGSLIRAVHTADGAVMLVPVGAEASGISTVVLTPGPGEDLTTEAFKDWWKKAVDITKKVVTAVVTDPPKAPPTTINVNINNQSGGSCTVHVDVHPPPT